jgi:hypothetical protein
LPKSSKLLLLILIVPAFKICGPFTAKVPLVTFRTFPVAICRLAIEGLLFCVTVLVPSTMQTLAEALLGTPFGFQLAATFQLSLPSLQVERLLVSVHWPNAEAEKRHAIAKTLKAFVFRLGRRGSLFVLKKIAFITLSSPSSGNFPSYQPTTS